MELKATYPFRLTQEDASAGVPPGTDPHLRTAAGGAARVNRADDEMTEPEAGPSRKCGKEPAGGKPKGTVIPVHDDDVSKYSYRALPADVKRFLDLEKLPVVVNMSLEKPVGSS